MFSAFSALLAPFRTHQAHTHRGIAIPWYTAESWPKLLEISSDRENLPRTYAEFKRRTGERVASRIARGTPLVKVPIDVTALAAWCRSEGIPINGRARQWFATYLLDGQQIPAEH